LPFDVRELDLIGPLVGADGGRAAAFVVRAVDQDAANGHLAHLAKGDFLRALHLKVELQ
jgi:hypothetical protein